MTPSPPPHYAPHQRPLGVLQLCTTFHRPPGDVAHPASWPFPIKVAVIGSATPEAIVGGCWSEDLVLAFVRAGRRLIEEEGCIGLVTSCGFLATMHPLLASHLPSIGTSALVQLPTLAALYPDPGAVGVLTFREKSLSIKHFCSVGANPNTPVAGLPEDGLFHQVLHSQRPYDAEGMLAEVLDAGERLRAACRKKGGELMAVVLECTNMSPFALPLARHLNVRVFDILTLGRLIHSSASMADFSPSPSTSPTSRASVPVSVPVSQQQSAVNHRQPQPQQIMVTPPSGVSVPIMTLTPAPTPTGSPGVSRTAPTMRLDLRQELSA